jgi:hypothetical protein
MAAKAACHVTFRTTFSGDTACTNATGVVIATYLFRLAALGIGLALRCSSTPGCIHTAVALVALFGQQGSTGSENQLSGDPREASDTLPPQPRPGGTGDNPPPVGGSGVETCASGVEPGEWRGVDKVLRHYTTDQGRIGIQADGVIRTGLSGRIYFTPTVYTSAASALADLALPQTPAGYFEIPRDRITDLEGPSCVDPGNGQPGGGIEYWTTHPIDATGLRWVEIAP